MCLAPDNAGVVGSWTAYGLLLLLLLLQPSTALMCGRRSTDNQNSKPMHVSL